MIALLTAVGIVAGTMLAALLAANLIQPKIGIWPAAAGHRQSGLVWLLLRGANVAALVCGISSGPLLEEADAYRILAAATAAAIVVIYVWSCVHLARENLYCGRAGLVTGGVYRWT